MQTAVDAKKLLTVTIVMAECCDDGKVVKVTSLAIKGVTENGTPRGFFFVKLVNYIPSETVKLNYTQC